MGQIRVLIADDHALFREGLALLLANEEAIHVVGQAADGHQAASMAETLQPDILLLDVKMPGMGGIEALPQIRRRCPRTKVLILTGFPEDEFVATAVRRGAKGCLSKAVGPKEVVKAIRAAHAGEIWAERKVLTAVLDSLRQKVHELNRSMAAIQETLTDREREIVKWVMQGMTNKEIAAQLGISEKTVKTHLSNIFGKLKISRRVQLFVDRVADPRLDPCPPSADLP